MRQFDTCEMSVLSLLFPCQFSCLVCLALKFFSFWNRAGLLLCTCLYCTVRTRIWVGAAEYSNRNKIQYQLMYQRQINKRAKRKTSMLWNSTLEQPFASELEWVFFFYNTAACFLLPLGASNELLSLFLFCSEINVGFHPCINIFTLLA